MLDRMLEVAHANPSCVFWVQTSQPLNCFGEQSVIILPALTQKPLKGRSVLFLYRDLFGANPGPASGASLSVCMPYTRQAICRQPPALCFPLASLGLRGTYLPLAGSLTGCTQQLPWGPKLQEGRAHQAGLPCPPPPGEEKR